MAGEVQAARLKGQALAGKGEHAKADQENPSDPAGSAFPLLSMGSIGATAAYLSCVRLRSLHARRSI